MTQLLEQTSYAYMPNEALAHADVPLQQTDSAAEDPLTKYLFGTPAKPDYVPATPR